MQHSLSSKKGNAVKEGFENHAKSVVPPGWKFLIHKVRQLSGD